MDTPVRLVILDLDGTLLATEHAVSRVAETILARYGAELKTAMRDKNLVRGIEREREREREAVGMVFSFLSLFFFLSSLELFPARASFCLILSFGSRKRTQKKSVIAVSACPSATCAGRSCALAESFPFFSSQSSDSCDDSDGDA